MRTRCLLALGVLAAPAITFAAPTLAPSLTNAEIAAARAERAPEPPRARPRALDVVPPGVVLFTANATNHVDIVRPVPDITGDGRDEILYGLRESNVPNVFLLDGASSGTATEVWSFMTTGGASNGYLYGDQCIVVSSDTDGNGYPNFLLGTAAGGRVAYAFDALAHQELWRFDTYLSPPDSGWIYSLAEMSDTTGDGVPEVAFGAGSFSDSLYDVDGASSGAASLLWRWQAPDAVVSVKNPGDADGDGDDDVVAAIGDTGHEVVALDGSPPSTAGAVIWTYPTGAGSVWSLGLLPDTTGDGVDEVLAAIWTTDGSAVRCLDGATGAQLWASTTVPDYAMTVEPIADVTGDGKADVVVGSWENAVQVLDGATGARVWKRTAGTTNGGDVWTVRAVGDLNGDGFPDVVAGSFDYFVYAYDGLNGWPFWSYSTGKRLYDVHGVGDLNGDGVPEVAASTQNLSGSSIPVVYVFDGDAGLNLPFFADDFENGAPVGWSSIVGAAR
jgi:hypothetical protein